RPGGGAVRACPPELVDPRRHRHRAPARDAARRCRDRRERVRLARRRHAAGLVVVVPGLFGGAGGDARHRVHRGRAQPHRRPAVRPAGPAHPIGAHMSTTRLDLAVAPSVKAPAKRAAGIAPAIVIGLYALFAIAGPLLVPYDPVQTTVADRLLPPGSIGS